ncbi:MAG: methionyl-tRNA formyltransferase [Alphaproteobacteria bacterium]
MTKLIFMGTPAFAVPSLQALHAAGHAIVAVYCQPPRPAGRGHQLQKSPVQVAAEALGLPVRTPEKLRGEALEELLATEADLITVVAYGLLLPKVLVESRVCLNVHPSALPRWRGAAPLPRTILAGDTVTDVCIMQLDSGMDTGPVRYREQFMVELHETTADLHDKCAKYGSLMLREVVGNLEAYPPVPQSTEGITHAAKITPDMRPIDWNKSNKDVHNHIRALSPQPGATCTHHGEVLKVLKSTTAWDSAPVGTPAGTILKVLPEALIVACGEKSVKLLTLQRAGKQALPVAEFLQGYTLQAGDILA